LLGLSAHPGEAVEDKHLGADGPAAPVKESGPAAAAMASAGLELEVLGLLDQTAANLGGQLSVTRSSAGILRVQGIVENKEHKEEILEALSSVIRNPAIRVDVSTVAEAVTRQARAKPSESMAARKVEITGNQTPIHEELRRYFAARKQKGLLPEAEESPESRVDGEIRRFSSRVMGRSRQALLHAWALKRLAERFSLEELRTLDPQARTKWQAISRNHARAFQIETEKLRTDLQPLFFQALPLGSVHSEKAITTDAEMLETISRLFELAAAHEKVILKAFTISQENEGAASIKTEQFWRSLLRAETLAASLQVTR
jgi:hypothetical protein